MRGEELVHLAPGSWAADLEVRQGCQLTLVRGFLPGKGLTASYALNEHCKVCSK